MTATAKPDALIELLEVTYGEPKPKVDRDAGVMHDVKILSKKSRNRREYSEQAMQQAARLYEGADVNVDHPADRKNLLNDRPVADGFGWLESVKVRPDGVYGDLHFLKSHPRAEMLCEAAEKNPRRFGLSHHAYGKAKLNPDGTKLVESVERVHSVDVVQNPACTESFFESLELNMESPAKVTLKAFIEKIDASCKGRKECLALLEEDDMGASGDYQVEAAPAEMSADDQVAAAFRSMVIAVLDDESLDVKGKVKKIADILKTEEKLTGAADDDDDDDDDDSEAATESLKLAQAHATELLEAAGIKPETGKEAAYGAKVKALASVTDSKERTALIESWRPALTVPAPRATKPLRSKPLMESREFSKEEKFPTDHKSFLAAVK